MEVIRGFKLHTFGIMTVPLDLGTVNVFVVIAMSMCLSIPARCIVFGQKGQPKFKGARAPMVSDFKDKARTCSTCRERLS